MVTTELIGWERRKSVRIGAAASILVFGAVVAAPSLSGVSASPMSVRPTTAKAVVNAPRDATWYGQMSPDMLCSVLPSCVSATTTSGGYRITLRGYVEGLGEIQQDVRARVAKVAPPRLMRLTLSSDSGLGSLRSTVDITLAPRGKTKTALFVTVKKSSGTGALAGMLLPFLESRLQAGVTAYADDLNQQLRASGILVRARTSEQGAKHLVKVRVLLKNPLVQPSPTAKGRARVTTAKGKTLCTAKITKSTGKCRYRKGPRRPRVVVTGSYSSGFPVWHATTSKAAK